MSYQSEVLADTPWLYWRLDDTSGTTAADTSGNGRTGTYSGSPTLAQSPLITDGTSVLFDATNDYCLSSSAIFNSSTATVEVWFDYDGTAPSPGANGVLAGCNEGDTSGVGEKLILLVNDGAGGGLAVFYVYDGAQKFATGATPLTVGRHHLVGTVDAAGGTAKIYVDGAQDGTVGVSGSYAGYTNPNAIVGGGSTALAGNVRKAGRRDEFALYTTALSAARILAHYQAGVAELAEAAWVTTL